MKIANYQQSIGKFAGVRQSKTSEPKHGGEKSSKFQQILYQQQSVFNALNQQSPAADNMKNLLDGKVLLEIIRTGEHESTEYTLAATIEALVNVIAENWIQNNEIQPVNEQIASLLMPPFNLQSNPILDNELNIISELQRKLALMDNTDLNSVTQSEELFGEIVEKLTKLLESQLRENGAAKNTPKVITNLSTLNNQQPLNVNPAHEQNRLAASLAASERTVSWSYRPNYGVDMKGMVQQESGIAPHLSQHVSGQSISIDEGAPEAIRSQQFSEQLLKIIHSSRFSRNGNNHAQLVVRLHPEHLGSLTIKLIRDNGELTAKIIASTSSAKELIEANIQQIRHAIPAQNIIIEKFDLLAQHTSDFAFRQQQQQSQERQHSENRKQNLDRDAEEAGLDFQDALDIEILNFKA